MASEDRFAGFSDPLKKIIAKLRAKEKTVPLLERVYVGGKGELVYNDELVTPIQDKWFISTMANKYVVLHYYYNHAEKIVDMKPYAMNENEDGINDVINTVFLGVCDDPTSIPRKHARDSMKNPIGPIDVPTVIEEKEIANNHTCGMYDVISMSSFLNAMKASGNATSAKPKSTGNPKPPKDTSLDKKPKPDAEGSGDGIGN
jgi:hypothetical protein